MKPEVERKYNLVRIIHERDDTITGRVIATRTVQPVCMYPVVWSLLKVKKLNLEGWMKRIEKDKFLRDKYKASLGFVGYPELGDGWFMGSEKYRESLRIFSWFQVDGKAYWHMTDLDGHFKYCMSLFHHRPLMQKELDAISILEHSRLATKEQQRLVLLDSQWKSIREVHRQTYYHFNKK